MAPPLRLPWMGSFAGYSVSVSTFEIVRLFFNGISSSAFFSTLRFDELLFWTFFSTPEDLLQFALHIPINFSSTSKLPGCNLFVATLSTLSDTRRLFFSMINQKLFCFSCAWRRLVMSEQDSWCLKKPDEAFHTRRHRPRRRHQEESRLAAPKTPIWLSQTHFAWQTKLWLSEVVSVRFNQNLLKQCTHKYYIRLPG